MMDPAEKPFSKKATSDALKRTIKDFTYSVKRDMTLQIEDPQQILPREYRHLNDTVNLLTDTAALSDVKEGLPKDRVQMLINATANFIKEENKYQNVYAQPESDPRQLVKKLGTYADKINTYTDRWDAMTRIAAENAMENDMIIGDGAPG